VGRPTRLREGSESLGARKSAARPKPLPTTCARCATRGADHCCHHRRRWIGGAAGHSGLRTASSWMRERHLFRISPEACAAIMWRDSKNSASSPRRLCALPPKIWSSWDASSPLCPNPRGGAHKDFERRLISWMLAWNSTYAELKKNPHFRIDACPEYIKFAATSRSLFKTES